MKNSIIITIIATLYYTTTITTTESLAFNARWKNYNPNNPEFKTITPPRSGHVSFRHDGNLYVFGGYAEETDGEGRQVKRFPLNDLWKWKSQNGWELIVQKGDIPGPRLVSAAAVIDGCPTLFGGWDPQTPGTGGIILDTIHHYDPSTQTWTFDGTLPEGPTSRHVAVTTTTDDGNAIGLVHNHRCVDHVVLYDPRRDSTTTVKKPTTGSSSSSSSPSPRGLHAGVVMSDGYFVVFGGASQAGAMSNELFVLDTRTWEWVDVSMTESSSTPTPRASPCFCPWGDNRALLFGGAESTPDGLRPRADLWCLTLKTTEEGGGVEARWDLVLGDDDDDDDVDAVVRRPPPRNAATMDEIDPPEGWTVEDGESFFLLQGGWSPFKTTWSDNYILRISAKTD